MYTYILYFAGPTSGSRVCVCFYLIVPFLPLLCPVGNEIGMAKRYR
jgi:hypothetical protein